jgi:hypothetical protein
MTITLNPKAKEKKGGKLLDERLCLEQSSHGILLEWFFPFASLHHQPEDKHKQIIISPHLTSLNLYVENDFISSSSR